MINWSVWSEACWLLASPSQHHSVPTHPTTECLLPCSFTDSLCCLYVGHFLQSCHRLLGLCLPVSSFLWEKELETDTCWVEQSCSFTSLMHHKRPQRMPRTYSNLLRIRLRPTRKDRIQELKVRRLGNSLALQMLHFEEVLSFRKKDAADEKRLIFHKVQTRFSHVRH